MHALRSLSLVAALAAAAPGFAQPSEAPNAAAWSAWQWCYEASVPGVAQTSPWIELPLPPEVLDECRPDLGDLRLLDGRGREVPLAVRLRRTQTRREELAAHQIERRAGPSRSLEATLDLGPNPAEHRLLEVHARGVHFCRRVQLEGSDDRQTWSTLEDSAWIACYQVETQLVSTNRVYYEPSRARYLRVRMFPDVNLPNDEPDIASLAVLRAPASEYVSYEAGPGPRERRGATDGPSAAWTLVFARGEELAEPLHLYAGNAEAEPPQYDFAAQLGEVLSPLPQLALLGPRQENPEWRQAREPPSDRASWAAYVVLACGGLVLATVVGLLALRAIRGRSEA